MAEDSKAFDPSLTFVLILIYGILGPLGLVPAALGLVAIYLARKPSVLQFVLNEYEAYHGSRGNSRYEKLKAELSESVRRDVSAQFATEKAGLKAQIGMINEELRSAMRDYEFSKKRSTEAQNVIGELRISQTKYHQELEALKLQLATLKKDLDKKQVAEKTAKGLFHFPAPAPVPTFGGLAGFGSKAAPVTSTAAGGPGSEAPPVTSTGFGGFGSKVAPSTTTSHPVAPKEPAPLKITLPSQLQHIDPTRSGFTCIGRAIVSHGGSCGSFSDEYLPRRRRDQAATSLKDMRSPNPSNDAFELPALRDLANNMLCIRHSRGCRHDQSDSIAQKWYNDLAPAREQIRKRRDEQKVATAPPLTATLTQSTMPTSEGWAFSSQPFSPASSASSMSVAASSPDQSPAVKKPLTDFGAGQMFMFGAPSPAPKVVGV